MQYICERKHFNRKIYKVGHIYDLSDEQLPKGKDGKILYFRPIDEVKPEVEAVENQDFKCEWCEKIAKSKAGLMAHQRTCSLNPDFIGLSR
jgi:hypothetical protein